MMKTIVMIAVMALVACNSGPLPPVPTLHTDSDRDRFPLGSEAPLPLDLAIQDGKLDEARRLLDSGADPNARWLGDRFPLQEVLEADRWHYQIGDPIEATRLLLQYGADPNQKWCPFETRGSSYDGRPSCTAETAMTPLIAATFVDSRSIVGMLLDAGADPFVRDWGEASALDYAYDEVVFEMIASKMFPDLSTRDRQALEWISRSNGSRYDASPWYATPVSRALTQREGVYYVPPPAPTPGSKTLYGVEREGRTIQRLNTLMRIGADPNERITSFSLDATPLSLALRSRQYRSAAVLLKNGADVNQRWCVTLVYRNYKPATTKDPECTPANGITPLMWSAGAGDSEAVQLLIEFNADSLLRDWAGRSALDYARTREIRDLLTAH